MKVNRCFYIGLLFLFITLVSTAQSTVQGKVLDQSNKPLILVTVILLKENKQLAGTSTDENGHFQLDYPFLHGEHYLLSLSLIGYQNQSRAFVFPDSTSYLHLQLMREDNTLNNVTVSARRPMITHRADRYIVNVENSILANGNSGLEVLQKSPGIWVSPDGKIQLRGGQSVNVMINDVLQRMSGEELADYLKTIKSEDISKIEIINNPPAEFEAAGSGGIIHIILKKGRKDGLSGSLNSQYRSQEGSPYFSAGASLDYKVNGLYLFGNSSMVYDENTSVGNNNIRYPDQSLFDSKTNRDNTNKRQQYRFGIGYDISKRHSIGFQTISTGSQLFHNFFTETRYYSNNITTTGEAQSEWIRKPALSSTTLNYSWKIDSIGTQLKLISDYTSSKRKESNHFSALYNEPTLNTTYRNQTPNLNRNYSTQIDFTKMLPWQLELASGFKYSLVKRDNKVLREDLENNTWVLNTGSSNQFLYKERLLMGYSTLSISIKQTSIKAGLRLEETYTKGNSLTAGIRFSKKYIGLFPSLYIMQGLNKGKGNSLYFNYARRLQRPSFSELNPYRLQFDKYTVMIGNPDLLPQFTHKIEGGYNFLQGFSASLYYATTNNAIAQLGRSLNNNMMEYQYRNFNNTVEYGFYLNAPVTIVKGWTSTSNFSVFNLLYSIEDFSHSQISFAAKSIHNINLKELADMYVIGEYRSPYVSANSKAISQFYSEVGLSKKVFKNNGGRVRFFVIDPFNTLHEKEKTDYKGVLVNFNQKRQTRILGVSFMYNFIVGKKFAKKSLEQSNNEERTRIGN